MFKAKLLLILFLLASFLVVSMGTSRAFAAYDPFVDTCKNSTSTVCNEARNRAENPQGSNSLYGPDSVLAHIITILSVAIGVAAVIVIIIAGIKFATSGGDTQAVTSARNTILYALIGIGIAASAQAIVVFVINKL